MSLLLLAGLSRCVRLLGEPPCLWIASASQPFGYSTMGSPPCSGFLSRSSLAVLTPCKLNASISICSTSGWWQFFFSVHPMMSVVVLPIRWRCALFYRSLRGLHSFILFPNAGRRGLSPGYPVSIH